MKKNFFKVSEYIENQGGLKTEVDKDDTSYLDQVEMMISEASQFYPKTIKQEIKVEEVDTPEIKESENLQFDEDDDAGSEQAAANKDSKDEEIP